MQTPLDPKPRSYPDAVTLCGRKPPPEPAPEAESAASIESWLLGPALELDAFLDAFHAFVWRLAAGPFGIDRASIHAGTLHPELYGYAWNWSRVDGLADEVRVAPDVLATDSYRRNPLSQVIEAGVRVRAVPAEAAAEAGLMADLAAQGFTDYVALPLNALGAQHNAATLATRRPGGFSPDTLTTLERLLAIFALHVERHIQRRIAANALAAYLGPAAGGEVLAGSIRRGDGRAMRAVVWCSDLRGFTDLSARLSGPETTTVLNAYFERLVGAVSAHRGEVLKFMGDGLLAVFPFESAAAALAAARAGLAAVARLGDDPGALPSVAGWRPLRSGVALHAGDVFFGNVGAPDRLDFTVIGQAVNVASRVEALTKSLGRPILVTEAAARLLPATERDGLLDMGRHALRDMPEPVQIFAPQ